MSSSLEYLVKSTYSPYVSTFSYLKYRQFVLLLYLLAVLGIFFFFMVQYLYYIVGGLLGDFFLENNGVNSYLYSSAGFNGMHALIYISMYDWLVSYSMLNILDSFISFIKYQMNYSAIPSFFTSLVYTFWGHRETCRNCFFVGSASLSDNHGLVDKIYCLLSATICCEDVGSFFLRDYTCLSSSCSASSFFGYCSYVFDDEGSIITSNLYNFTSKLYANRSNLTPLFMPGGLVHCNTVSSLFVFDIFLLDGISYETLEGRAASIRLTIIDLLYHSVRWFDVTQSIGFFRMQTNSLIDLSDVYFREFNFRSLSKFRQYLCSMSEVYAQLSFCFFDSSLLLRSYFDMGWFKVTALINLSGDPQVEQVRRLGITSSKLFNYTYMHKYSNIFLHSFGGSFGEFSKSYKLFAPCFELCMFDNFAFSLFLFGRDGLFDNKTIPSLMMHSFSNPFNWNIVTDYLYYARFSFSSLGKYSLPCFDVGNLLDGGLSLHISEQIMKQYLQCLNFDTSLLNMDHINCGRKFEDSVFCINKAPFISDLLILRNIKLLDYLITSLYQFDFCSNRAGGICCGLLDNKAVLNFDSNFSYLRVDKSNLVNLFFFTDGWDFLFKYTASNESFRSFLFNVLDIDLFGCSNLYLVSVLVDLLGSILCMNFFIKLCIFLSYLVSCSVVVLVFIHIVYSLEFLFNDYVECAKLRSFFVSFLFVLMYLYMFYYFFFILMSDFYGTCVCINSESSVTDPTRLFILGSNIVNYANEFLFEFLLFDFYLNYCEPMYLLKEVIFM